MNVLVHNLLDVETDGIYHILILYFIQISLQNLDFFLSPFLAFLSPFGHPQSGVWSKYLIHSELVWKGKKFAFILRKLEKQDISRGSVHKQMFVSAQACLDICLKHIHA